MNHSTTHVQSNRKDNHLGELLIGLEKGVKSPAPIDKFHTRAGTEVTYIPISLDKGSCSLSSSASLGNTVNVGEPAVSGDCGSSGADALNDVSCSVYQV